MTADKSSQALNLNAEDAKKKMVLEKYFEKSGKALRFRFYHLKPDTFFLSDIFSNLIVDNPDAAFVQILANYSVTLAEVENISDEIIRTDRKSFTVPFGESLLEPIFAEEFPEKIYCINWKGNLKNTYNLAVISATSVFIISAVAGCLKEGKCDAVGKIPDVLKLAQSGEKDPAKTFSSPVFSTDLKYSNTFKFENLTVPPKTRLTGIILYKRPIQSLHLEKFTTAANCIVK